MKWQRQLVVGGAVVILGGVAASEHISRRLIGRRYQRVLASHEDLERHVASMLASHRRVTADLAREQQRSQELTKVLATTQWELERAAGRLAEETKAAQDYRVRLTSMQQQMDRLQAELAIVLEDQRETARQGGAGPIQLERIVISDAGTRSVHGRVLSIHRDWNFIIVDLGWNAVKIGDFLSIYRNDQLLAKARVERVQEGVCAATLLPEWVTAEIHVNDLVRTL